MLGMYKVIIAVNSHLVQQAVLWKARFK